MDIRKVYEYALQREHEGKAFFEQNAARLSHASAREAFLRLAAEEQKHIEYIQAQLARLDAGQPADLAMGPAMEAAGFFSARASKESVEQSVLEAMVPDLPVLRMAYLIERDFAEFYELAARNASGEAQKALETLAYWERRHEELFQSLHDQAFEKYANMPWGG